MSSKKESVINTARELFSTYGYTKVSMDEIAKNSGVTKKTIYTYFKDKNELIKYFLYDEIETLKKFTDEIDKKDIPFEDKIHQLIETQMEYRSNSKILKSLLKESGKMAVECKKILDTTLRNELNKKLKKAIDNGYIKDCDTEIVSFLIYKIYVALMFELDRPIDKKEATENIMNIFKAWLLK